MLIEGRSIADPLSPYSGRIQHVCFVHSSLLSRAGGEDGVYDDGRGRMGRGGRDVLTIIFRSFDGSTRWSMLERGSLGVQLLAMSLTNGRQCFLT